MPRQISFLFTLIAATAFSVSASAMSLQQQQQFMQQTEFDYGGAYGHNSASYRGRSGTSYTGGYGYNGGRYGGTAQPTQNTAWQKPESMAYQYKNGAANFGSSNANTVARVETNAAQQAAPKGNSNRALNVRLVNAFNQGNNNSATRTISANEVVLPQVNSASPQFINETTPQVVSGSARTAVQAPNTNVRGGSFMNQQPTAIGATRGFARFDSGERMVER